MRDLDRLPFHRAALEFTAVIQASPVAAAAKIELDTAMSALCPVFASADTRIVGLERVRHRALQGHGSP